MEYNRLCKLYEHISIHAVTDKYGIPYTTFWKCVTGGVMGTGYKIFSEGMFWSLFYFYFFFFNLFFLFSTYHLPDYILVNVHFAAEQEKELVKLILMFSCACFLLSKKRVHSLAYQYAHENKIKGFSNKRRKQEEIS